MQDKDYWDKVYQGKLDNKEFRQFSNEELSKILTHFPQARTAFDLGCGQGLLLKQLKDKGVEAYGVEYSEEAKKQSLLPEFTHIADLNSFVPPYIVDIFFLKFVIAFIENKDFLRSLKPFLNNGGGIVILTPVGEGLGCCIKEERLKAMCKGFAVEKEEVWYSKDDKKLVLLILKKQP